MSIQQLAPDVAAKIAAGEVVERPASVVKELIENSIDAGATQIRVDLSSGGLQLIRVTDNGCGIASDELPLALARHATSKVAQINDLEHIRSLGFRGEALASIAAVAEVTLLSRPRSSAQGAQIGAINGQISAIAVAASAEGTTITVRNLFSAVPARLKFLKSRNTEVSHCHHLLQQYALAYPEIRFSVFSEGRQIFATPGDGQLAGVLVEVYGLAVAEQMVPISGNEHPDNPEYPIVHGYVSRPTCYKSTRQYISFFVNRRWVLSRMLTAAVEGAYHSLLLTGRHPIAVVNIQIDPSMLDVNVHPAKTEIRFLKERRIFAAILHAIRDALLQEPEVPQWQPPTPTVGTELAPIRDPETPPPPSTVGTGLAPVRDDTIPSDNPWITVAEEETGTKPPHLSRLWQSHIRSATVGIDPHEPKQRTLDPGQPDKNHREEASPPPSLHPSEDLQTIDPLPQTLPASAETDGPYKHQKGPMGLTGSQIGAGLTGASLTAQDLTDTETGASLGELGLPHSGQETSPSSTLSPIDAPDPSKSRSVDDGLTPSPDWGKPKPPSRSPDALIPQQLRRLPRLRVVGQVAQSYIVTEGEDGMYLIDQHAAHERILLERMVTALKARTPISQLLLTPMALSLSPVELEAIEEHQQQLEHIGFTLAIADNSTLEVLAVPGVLVKQMNVRSLHELLVTLTSEESLGHTETWEERALANVACKAAIKANYFLTVSEMREMLEQLEQTKAPFSCCHGRPTMVHFSLSALARAFERR